jgi:hypothetical protein
VVSNLVGHGSAVRTVAWVERTLAAQRDPDNSLWDTQFDRELLPWEDHRGRNGRVVDPTAAHRLGRQRRHGPDLSVRSRHLLHVCRTSARSKMLSSSDGRLVMTASSNGTAGI